MMRLQGIIPALVTPMRADGALDLAAIAPLVDTLIANGADALFAVGSMGEAASLGVEERLQVVSAAVRAAGGRVPVLAGTGFVTTEETIRATRACQDAGAAAVSVITPFYWKLSQEELYAHYARVIERSPLPVFAYNLPKNTGLNLEPETVGRLYRQAGLAGAKDSSAVWENTKGYLDETDADFQLLVGEDTLCLQGLMHGSHGSISAPANAYTFVMKAIYTRFRAGDMPGARQAQADWDRLIALLGSTGHFPANFKLAADRLTTPVGPPRRPVLPADPALLEAVRAEAEAIAAPYRP